MRRPSVWLRMSEVPLYKPSTVYEPSVFLNFTLPHFSPHPFLTSVLGSAVGSHYWKQGLYRQKGDDRTDTLFMGPFVRGYSFSGRYFSSLPLIPPPFTSTSSHLVTFFTQLIFALLEVETAAFGTSYGTNYVAPESDTFSSSTTSIHHIHHLCASRFSLFFFFCPPLSCTKLNKAGSATSQQGGSTTTTTTSPSPSSSTTSQRGAGSSLSLSLLCFFLCSIYVCGADVNSFIK